MALLWVPSFFSCWVLLLLTSAWAHFPFSFLSPPPPPPSRDTRRRLSCYSSISEAPSSSQRPSITRWPCGTPAPAGDCATLSATAQRLPPLTSTSRAPISSRRRWTTSATCGTSPPAASSTRSSAFCPGPLHRCGASCWRADQLTNRTLPPHASPPTHPFSRGHKDEVYDLKYDVSGKLCVLGSADGVARIYDTSDYSCIAELKGHSSEITYVRCLCPRLKRVARTVSSPPIPPPPPFLT